MRTKDMFYIFMFFILFVLYIIINESIKDDPIPGGGHGEPVKELRK